MFGKVHGKIMEKRCLKAPGNYSASFGTYNFSICLRENPQPPHVYDFETFGHVPEIQHPYYLSLETPGYFKKSKQYHIISKHIISANFKSLEIHNVETLEKTGAENPDDPFNKIMKIMNMRSISIKNMKWTFGTTGSSNR